MHFDPRVCYLHYERHALDLAFHPRSLITTSFGLVMFLFLFFKEVESSTILCIYGSFSLDTSHVAAVALTASRADFSRIVSPSEVERPLQVLWRTLIEGCGDNCCCHLFSVPLLSLGYAPPPTSSVLCVPDPALSRRYPYPSQ